METKTKNRKAASVTETGALNATISVADIEKAVHRFLGEEKLYGAEEVALAGVLLLKNKEPPLAEIGDRLLRGLRRDIAAKYVEVYDKTPKIQSKRYDLIHLLRDGIKTAEQSGDKGLAEELWQRYREIFEILPSHLPVVCPGNMI